MKGDSRMEQGKTKKAIYKKWWFWVIIAVVVAAVIVGAVNGSNPNGGGTKIESLAMNDPSEQTLYVDGSGFKNWVKISPVYFDENEIEFVSTNPEVATISSGTKTVGALWFACAAVTPGETTVYAQTKDGAVKSEEVKVTVKKLGDSGASVSSQAPVQPKEPELAITATDLLTAYDENGVQADNQYKGKYLKVTGTVGNIGTDILGDAYVTLKNENSKYAIISVQCYFDDNNTDTIANLKEGDSVSITGTCSGSTGNVILKGCDVVS